MNCPFKNVAEIKDPALLEVIERLVACAACPNEVFCDSCECLKCPFFPEALRQHLLEIEMKMVKTHKHRFPYEHGFPAVDAPDQAAGIYAPLAH